MFFYALDAAIKVASLILINSHYYSDR